MGLSRWNLVLGEAIATSCRLRKSNDTKITTSAVTVQVQTIMSSHALMFHRRSDKHPHVKPCSRWVSQCLLHHHHLLLWLSPWFPVHGILCPHRKKSPPGSNRGALSGRTTTNPTDITKFSICFAKSILFKPPYQKSLSELKFSLPHDLFTNEYLHEYYFLRLAVLIVVIRRYCRPIILRILCTSPRLQSMLAHSLACY